MSLKLTFWLPSVVTLAAPLWSQLPIYTGQYNLSRTSANLAETALTTSNVNPAHFGLLFSRAVDGPIYAQPLYVPNVTINGTTQNVVYVATMNNTVYAFDADSAAASAPLWSVNLGTPRPFNTTRLFPTVGVLGTPVIDPATNTLYAVAATFKNNVVSCSLHALDITSGNEKFNGPVTIQASVPGTAPDAVNGMVSFNPFLVLQRAALLLFGGVVHIAFGGEGPGAVSHGWLIGYNAATLARAYAASSSPNGSGGGIWMSGRGPAGDATGMYFSTANGSLGGGNFGEAIIRVGGSVDYFVPDNFSLLNLYDWDLGSGGVMLLPGTNLLATAGKTGTLFLLNRSNLGQEHPGNTGAVQSFQATPPCSGIYYNSCDEIHHMTYWARNSGPPYLYVWAWKDTLKEFALSNGKLITTPVAQFSVSAGYPGGILALSANGSTAGTGVLWAVTSPQSYDGTGAAPAAVLHAFDASNVATELWNSNMNPADALGALAKFAVPVVTNGKVYLATDSNALRVYALR
jgi:hypothetical protein